MSGHEQAINKPSGCLLAVALPAKMRSNGKRAPAKNQSEVAMMIGIVMLLGTVVTVTRRIFVVKAMPSN